MAAFSDDPRGGNPAGVVVGDAFPPDDVMQGLAQDIGYSETVFLAGDGGTEWRARYWSPLSEVAVLRPRDDRRRLAIQRTAPAGSACFRHARRAGAGRRSVEIGGATCATLTSVDAHVRIAPETSTRATRAAASVYARRT